MRAAVFLDKDGTLIENVPYNVDPARIRLVPDAPRALQLLARAGYVLAVVSNQSGVARGYFEEDALTAVEVRLCALFAECGVSLAAFGYCPHHPEGTVAAYRVSCNCRKPAPGLLLTAARELGLDLAASWMIGDILDDVEAGRRAGCRTVLVDVGNETEWLPGPQRTPHLMVRSLAEAAEAIVGGAGPGRPLLQPSRILSPSILSPSILSPSKDRFQGRGASTVLDDSPFPRREGGRGVRVPGTDEAGRVPASNRDRAPTVPGREGRSSALGREQWSLVPDREGGFPGPGWKGGSSADEVRSA
ncbi:MAG: D-glycero-D-manno-heptose 1,7-bisphosphate phosphatase [Chloroflexota bacterium]|jgi:histidinol-phosphate phosphatase family protein|nr:D-glycero-D-manno-heptose 1,7-bisphosphate phosphatase [Chloroflexota bacterium]